MKTSVFVLDGRRIRAAGGLHDFVFAQIEKHLSIVVGIVPGQKSTKAS
jgi:hypothetical protein